MNESPSDDFRVLPPDGPSRAEQEDRFRDPPDLSDPQAQLRDEQRRSRQFTLREMLLLTTFATIGIAGVRWLPEGGFAFAAGLAALAVLFVNTQNRVLQTATWALVIIYATATFVTIVSKYFL